MAFANIKKRRKKNTDKIISSSISVTRRPHKVISSGIRVIQQPHKISVVMIQQELVKHVTAQMPGNQMGQNSPKYCLDKLRK